MHYTVRFFRGIPMSLLTFAFLGAALAAAAEAPPAAPAPETEPPVLEARRIVDLPVEARMPSLKKGGSDYRIGRQDLLQLSVFDLKELDQTVRVADDGSITLPLLDLLQVAGLTKGELEALIARLREERFVRNPQVTVFVREYQSKRIAVSGAVKKPDT